jgi:hypothetical protein
VPVAVVISSFALLFLGLGSYLGARQGAEHEAQFAALRAELTALRHTQLALPTGTSGRTGEAVALSADRAAIVDDVKRQLTNEMGLLPLNLLRERRESFVELYSYDDRGASSYGTAGYLGNGYFITVKHGVVALGQEGAVDPRKITSVKIAYQGKLLNARIIDVGDATVEVDPGDWRSGSTSLTRSSVSATITRRGSSSPRATSDRRRRTASSPASRTATRACRAAAC